MLPQVRRTFEERQHMIEEIIRIRIPRIPIIIFVIRFLITMFVLVVMITSVTWFSCSRMVLAIVEDDDFVDAENGGCASDATG